MEALASDLLALVATISTVCSIFYRIIYKLLVVTPCDITIVTGRQLEYMLPSSTSIFLIVFSRRYFLVYSSVHLGNKMCASQKVQVNITLVMKLSMTKRHV